MKNNAELGLHGCNTELGDENDGNVEGESNEQSYVVKVK